MVTLQCYLMLSVTLECHLGMVTLECSLSPWNVPLFLATRDGLRIHTV